MKLTIEEFKKKYGLEGKGNPVRISQRLRDYVKMLHKRSEAIIASGEYAAKHDTTRYR